MSEERSGFGRRLPARGRIALGGFLVFLLSGALFVKGHRWHGLSWWFDDDPERAPWSIDQFGDYLRMPFAWVTGGLALLGLLVGSAICVHACRRDD